MDRLGKGGAANLIDSQALLSCSPLSHRVPFFGGVCGGILIFGGRVAGSRRCVGGDPDLHGEETSVAGRVQLPGEDRPSWHTVGEGPPLEDAGDNDRCGAAQGDRLGRFSGGEGGGAVVSRGGVSGLEAGLPVLYLFGIMCGPSLRVVEGVIGVAGYGRRADCPRCRHLSGISFYAAHLSPSSSLACQPSRALKKDFAHPKSRFQALWERT